MLKAISVTLLVLSATAGANAAVQSPRRPLDVSMGYKKVSEAQAQAFEKSLKIDGIKCEDVVTIPTAGDTGSATASICQINDSVVWACRNDMTGVVAVSPETPVSYKTSDGLNLTAFILQNCIGS